MRAKISQKFARVFALDTHGIVYYSRFSQLLLCLLLC